MGRKPRCALCVCEACGVEIHEGQLTRFQGKWRCDDCLEGEWEPVRLPNFFSPNMVAWEEQETFEREDIHVPIHS